MLRTENYIVLFWIIFITLWRLVIAATLPVTQDEAYYFDWASNLQWGYFDHPPGVALLSLGSLIKPGSIWLARLGGILLGTLTLWILARFYNNCGLNNPWIQTLALIFATTTLPGFANGVLTSPDSVLTFAWVLALHESERALAGKPNRWITVGLACGLGLLGKYTMLFLGPILLWSIWRSDPKTLRTLWPYLGASLAIFLWGPNLLWNAQHDWVSLRFQISHGFALAVGSLDGTNINSLTHTGPTSFYARCFNLIKYFGIQLGCLGLFAPLFFYQLLFYKRPPSLNNLNKLNLFKTIFKPHTFILIKTATLFPLILCACLAIISPVKANWPAMYLFTFAPLITIWLLELKFWIILAASINLLLINLITFHAATGLLPFPNSWNRILRETHGFTNLAELVAKLDPPVYADRYQTIAMLRFYHPELQISQWPGLARPSEYLLGQITPRINPQQIYGSFWLITKTTMPKNFLNFQIDTQKILYDCPQHLIQENSEPPCRFPLHTWHLTKFSAIPKLTNQ